MASGYVKLSREDYRNLKVIHNEKPLPCPKILGLLWKLQEQIEESDIDPRASCLCIRLDHGSVRNIHGVDYRGKVEGLNIRAVKEAIESAGVKPEEPSQGLWRRFIITPVMELFQTEVQVPLRGVPVADG